MPITATVASVPLIVNKTSSSSVGQRRSTFSVKRETRRGCRELRGTRGWSSPREASRSSRSAVQCSSQPDSSSAPPHVGQQLASIAASVCLLAASTSNHVLPAVAFGPEIVPLEVTGYEQIACSGGRKYAKCVEVTAAIDAKTFKKPAFNSEVFGRVRYDNEESALYGDFAEATDAGKISDILEEINKDTKAVKFEIQLLESKSEGLDHLNFSNMKIRTYPGMRSDFRQMTTVSQECEEAAWGGECPEELPF
mmetsp:Transcript_29215/g.35501  ORF Transcript_29215/g.35501 Transcript_29215/m.35501 type:complete len:252 (-) Transcript_29215:341-1096(-)|eukprot:CAMPEP_0197849322 /NCGR_PEP_ID=MMETSP1438-20131217/11636_1 /TAXON_ID=1461541 /ORGANISM="Pterosperma sp., Strain CCMP1384" /LENGTH=251 /DNA_ID=CAMNT_0043461945 /DNA_START=136 /DNA_END=891 /DNA_ORIENTATION=-